MMEEISNNRLIEEMSVRLSSVRLQIEEAAKACGRPQGAVTLIGVSKFFPAEYAVAAYTLGLRDLGENRVQELLEKEAILSSRDLHPQWHLIGTLQTNKVKSIVGHCSLIHSVSSIKLLEEIQNVSSQKDTFTNILLQVNISGEETKHGFSSDEIHEVIKISNDMRNVNVKGLMTMAPIRTEVCDPYDVFARTQDLFETLRKDVANSEEWSVLSMGMSQDYIDAIRCGATHIRIGTAIFGHRS